MSQQNTLFSPDVVPLLVNTDQFVSTSVSDNPTEIGHWGDNSRLTEEVTDTTPLVQNVLPLVGFSVAQAITTDTEGFHILHSNSEPITMVSQSYLAAEPTENLQPVTEMMAEPGTGMIQSGYELIVMQNSIPGASGDMCSTAYLHDGFSKQVKIFKEVTAVLSTEILSVIQGSQSVLLQTIQSEYGVQLSLANETECDVPEIHISGDLSALTKVEHKLESVCGVTHADNDSGEIDNVMTVNSDVIKEIGKAAEDITCNVACPQIKKPEMVDKAISCDLLQPTISQRGRVIKPLSKYNSYVQLNSLLETEDIDENPRSRRKRKTRPQRLNPPAQDIHLAQSEDETKPVQSSLPYVEELTELTHDSSLREGDQTGDKLVAADISEQNAETEENDRCYENTEDSLLASDAPTERKAKTKKDYERLAPFKFFCKKCSFRTKRLSHFNNHKRLHEKPVELHRCKKCNFSSLRLSHLNRHEATHSIKIFSCDKCTYNTHQFKLLDRHKRTKHHPDKEYPRQNPLLSCPCCDYSTERQFHYQRHMRTHPEFANDADAKLSEDGKNFSCDLCPYTTQRKECLYRHKGNKHSDKRPYLCDLCGKSFKRPDALVQHKITHIDKRFRNYHFKCEICPKVFRSQAHLTDHQGSHSTQKSHLCYICGTAFKTRSVQRKHMQTIHLNPGAFQCQHCQKRFNTKFALNRHVRTHLSEQSSDTVSHTSIINAGDVSGTEMTTETQHIHVHQVHDVIVPPVGEVYEPGEALKQALIQGPQTVYYLSGFSAFNDGS